MFFAELAQTLAVWLVLFKQSHTSVPPKYFQYAINHTLCSVSVMTYHNCTEGQKCLLILQLSCFSPSMKQKQTQNHLLFHSFSLNGFFLASKIHITSFKILKLTLNSISCDKSPETFSKTLETTLLGLDWSVTFITESSVRSWAAKYTR